MNKYLNKYKYTCGCCWEDHSESMNNDRCPECNKEIEPIESVDVFELKDNLNYKADLKTLKKIKKKLDEIESLYNWLYPETQTSLEEDFTGGTKPHLRAMQENVQDFLR